MSFHIILPYANSARMAVALPRILLCGLCFFALWCYSPISSLAAQAQSEAQNRVSAGPISLAILPPLELSPRPAPLEQSLLTAYTPSGGLPSFNILHLAGSFPASHASLSAWSDELAASYRKVGLQEVQVLEHPESLSRPGVLPYFVVSYRNKADRMVGIVAIDDFPTEHFVMTWTDNSDNRASLTQLAQKMLATYQNELRTKAPPTPPRLKSQYVLVGLLLLALSVLGFARWRRKTHRLSA